MEKIKPWHLQFNFQISTSNLFARIYLERYSAGKIENWRIKAKFTLVQDDKVVKMLNRLKMHYFLTMVSQIIGSRANLKVRESPEGTVILWVAHLRFQILLWPFTCLCSHWGWMRIWEYFPIFMHFHVICISLTEKYTSSDCWIMF